MSYIKILKIFLFFVVVFLVLEENDAFLKKAFVAGKKKVQDFFGKKPKKVICVF